MDITLTIFLFIIVFSFLCWLTTPVNQPQTSSIQQPIEQQFKQVLQEIDQEVEEGSGESAVGSQKEEFPDSPITTHNSLSSQSPSKPVTIVQPTPVEETDSTSTPDIDLTKINIKQARQIAKTLGITQTVKGKAKPKALLIRQIKQKLNQQNIKSISQLLTA